MVKWSAQLANLTYRRFSVFVLGDTVYYRFTSDSSNYDWGWKFTVTGGQLGRFVLTLSNSHFLLSLNTAFRR